MNRSLLMLNIIVVALLLGMQFAPGGKLREHLSERSDARQRAKALDDLWPVLVDGDRLGQADGAVLMVVFADYQCPYCRDLHNTLKAVLPEVARGAVVYRHLPLTRVHPAALDAAMAAACAAAQDSFESMHDALYASDSWMDTRDWKGVAELAGVPDPVRLANCVAERAMDSIITEDRQLARRLLVSGTPSLVFPDGVVEGAMDRLALLDRLSLAAGADGRSPTRGRSN